MPGHNEVLYQGRFYFTARIGKIRRVQLGEKRRRRSCLWLVEPLGELQNGGLAFAADAAQRHYLNTTTGGRRRKKGQEKKG